MPGLLFRTRLTVASLTPAYFATSASLGVMRASVRHDRANCCTPRTVDSQASVRLLLARSRPHDRDRRCDDLRATASWQVIGSLVGSSRNQVVSLQNLVDT